MGISISLSHSFSMLLKPIQNMKQILPKDEGVAPVTR